MIGPLTPEYRSLFLRELQPEGLTYTRVINQPGGSVELIAVLRSVVKDARSFEELFDLTHRHLNAARDAATARLDVFGECHRLVYENSERLVLRAALNAYLKTFDEAPRRKRVAGASEDAFVVVRTGPAADMEDRARDLLRRV